MSDEKTPATTTRDYRGVDGAVDDAQKKGKKKAAPAPTRRSNSTSTSQALQSERKPKADEGARSFGAPMNTTGAETLDNRRKNQSTDDSQ